MARKKKKTTKTAASTRPAKTLANNKATRKKSTPKKSPSVPRSTSSRGNSVDGILKKFQKERLTEETKLTKIKNKIADLEAKTRAYREQIENLTEQEIATEQSISQLDSRRDQEIGELLAKLGVQLGPGNHSPAPNGTAPPSIIRIPEEQEEKNESTTDEPSTDSE